MTEIQFPPGWVQTLTRKECFKLLSAGDMSALPEGWEDVLSLETHRQLVEWGAPPDGPLFEARRKGCVIEFWGQDGWTAKTPHGYVTSMWRGRLGTLADATEACKIADQVRLTGQPPFGGWS